MIDIIKETYASLFSTLTLSIWGIATAGAVIAGPFGTFDSMDLTLRLVYWPLVTTSSVVLGYLAHAVTRILIGTEHSPMGRILVCLLGTLFIATDVYLLHTLVLAEKGTAVSYSDLLIWVGFVFCSAVLGRMMFTKAISSEQQLSDASTLNFGDVKCRSEHTPTARIISRLPKGQHGLVMRLSANDHFVHIVTQEGEHPVRMRLRDAIAEVDGVEGSLVHRSHWVAHAAIEGQDRGQGKVQIVLSNGDRVPVSRNYRSVLDHLSVPDHQTGARGQSSVSVQ